MYQLNPANSLCEAMGGARRGWYTGGTRPHALPRHPCNFPASTLGNRPGFDLPQIQEIDHGPAHRFAHVHVGLGIPAVVAA